MVLKLTDAADLEKAGNALGAYFAKMALDFEKSHSFHKAAASHHESLHKAHAAHAADCTECAKAMDNDHEMKGHMTKTAGSHEQMAACQKALADEHNGHADHFKTQIDTIKVLASQLGGSAPTHKAAAAAGSGPSIADLTKGE